MGRPLDVISDIAKQVRSCQSAPMLFDGLLLQMLNVTVDAKTEKVKQLFGYVISYIKGPHSQRTAIEQNTQQGTNSSFHRHEEAVSFIKDLTAGEQVLPRFCILLEY